VNTPRLCIANLDCERDFAMTSVPTGDARAFDLGPAATHTSAAFGTLLRAFLDDTDRLWLPVQVDPARLPAVEGVAANPTLECGAPGAIDRAGAVLSWGCTASTDRLVAISEPAMSPADLEGPIVDALWNLPRCSPESAAHANDRERCLELATMLGCALPGASVVSSPGDLERHLQENGAASPDDEWIIKSRFSAAGRWRFRGRGRYPLDERGAATVDNLFSRFGSLIFEPWMTRSDDFGCTAIVTRDALCVAGFHRQSVDSQGRFRGLELTTGSPRTPWFTSREAQVLQGVVEVVGLHLRKLGYVGPFGIDAWRYQDMQGAIGFQPLGECNARMTMGLAARAWVERLLSAGKLNPNERVKLRMGKDDPTRLEPCDDTRVIPLLLPGGDDGVAVWLEVDRDG
jgi:hypothetical protein